MNKNYNSIHTKFESILNKTFDKRGSLSYSIGAEKLRTQQKFKDKEIDNLTIMEENDNVSSY